MSQIVFYFLNNPLYLNQKMPFQVGFIDSDNSLTNITYDNDLIIDIIHPSNGQASIIDPDISLQLKNMFVQGVEQNVTLFMQISYDNIVQQFSYCFVQPLPNITADNLYKNFISYLPKNVYNTAKNPDSPVYCDNTATVTVLEQIYNNTELQTLLGDTQEVAFVDLQTIVNSFYPSSGNPQWEYALVGTNTLYTDSYNYESLLTLLYQTNKNNNTNPYFLALNISKYIYYRLGQKYYVLIGENNVDLANAFILDLNQLSRCIFNNGNDFPGVGLFTIVIFIINGAGLSIEFKNELYNFVRRIVSPYFLLEISYNYTLNDLGLTIPLDNTYWKDPRQLNTSCIQFNENILAQALGYTTIASDAGLISITDYSITLSPPIIGNTLVLGQTYVVTINTTPAITLAKPIIYYTEFFSSDQSVLGTYFDGVNENFVANAVGTATIKVYLGVSPGTGIPLNPLTITYTIS